MSQTGMRIEWRPIDALIPYARNSRTHSAEQLAQIAASMAEFGWTNPVLVDGANGIIAGHGRVLAARIVWDNGGTIKNCPDGKVPVIELAHLSETQKRAYVLVDNKLPENAGWDNELLKVELEELQADSFDLALTGFSEQEIKDLLTPPDNSNAEGRGLGTPVIHYDIIFDTEHQQEKWFNFIRWLNQRYEHADTVGERLKLYIIDLENSGEGMGG